VNQNFGDIFNIPLRIQSFYRLKKMLDKNIRKTPQEKQGLTMLNKLITFTKNNHRRIVLVVDCTHDCIEYIDAVKDACRVVDSHLNSRQPRKPLKMETY
jgi:hypothetical protein